MPTKGMKKYAAAAKDRRSKVTATKKISAVKKAMSTRRKTKYNK